MRLYDFIEMSKRDIYMVVFSDSSNNALFKGYVSDWWNQYGNSIVMNYSIDFDDEIVFIRVEEAKENIKYD